MFIVTNVDFNLLLPIEPPDEIAESAAKIAIYNFQWSYTTFVLFNSTVAVSSVRLFLRLYKKGQIIGNGSFYPSFAETTRQFVLFGTDLDNIELMLNWMKSHKFDNSGNFIILCLSKTPQECDETRAVNMFWNHKIVNVVFMKQPTNEVTGYTYYPEESCHIHRPAKMDSVPCPNNNTCFGIFPEKMGNLHCCPLIVTTFKQMPYMNITNGIPHGADGDLLLLIAERLNATLKMMTPQIGTGWGSLGVDGVWTGSLADLLDDVANFSMTSAAITLARFSHFQMSNAYYSVNVAWITHPAEKKPASLKLFYPFQTLSQIVLAISLIFVGMCAWFVNSKYWPTHNSEEVSKSNGILFYSWMICMGLPSTKLPAKKEFLYLALIWIWYCFLIRTLYQVCLINSLQGNFYYGEINTIEEAYDANYSFGGGLALKEYFIDYPLVYDNWKNINPSDIVPTLMNLSGKKFVLAMNLETAKSVIKKHNLSVHILPQNIVNSPTVIFFKKFSPVAESINIILRRLVESGLTEKIYKKYASKKTLTSQGNEPITLEHYTGCYAILFVGWAVSSVAFMIELCHSHFIRWKCRVSVKFKKKFHRSKIEI
ncbi:uncharacterized protein LOC135074181 [Ostrinia nubilalis]|uniref:uncharacterized protein LOC135074181 n=1 Tax=Ostrinia nubilalis TaxID=29057 RepID=UPI00308266D2